MKLGSAKDVMLSNTDLMPTHEHIHTMIAIWNRVAVMITDIEIVTASIMW